MKKLINQIEEIVKNYSDSELQEAFKFLKVDNSREAIFLTIKNEMSARVLAQLKEEFKSHVQSLSYEKLLKYSEVYSQDNKDPYFLACIEKEIEFRQAKEIQDILGSVDPLPIVKERFEVKDGDIFYSSWGYEQTNVDFYQVVKRTKKSVYLRQIKSEVINGDQRIPVKNEFIGESFRRVLQSYSESYSVSLNTFSSAYQWDGKPKSFTTYG